MLPYPITTAVVLEMVTICLCCWQI